MDLFGDNVEVEDAVPSDMRNESVEQDNTEVPVSQKEDLDHTVELDQEDDLFGDGVAGEEEELDEQNEEDPAAEEIITKFTVPNHKTPGDRGEILLAKLPSFLDIESMPFDANTLLTKIQQLSEESADNDEKLTRKRSLLNTMRWRVVEKDDGTTENVSNSRMVKWSDGSMSLQIGEELFDMPMKTIIKDHSYLTLMHPEEGILRCVKRFNKSLSFLPYGLSSKSHADLKADIARRSITSKGRTVKVHATLINPEQMQKDAIKAESDRLKARRRLDSQKARSMNNIGERTGARLTANYLDDSDEDVSGQRGGYLDDNEDGFVEDDEDEVEASAGASRLQALKDAGAQKYKDKKPSTKRTEGSDDDLSEDESIVYEDGADLESEEEAVMTPKRGRSPESEKPEQTEAARPRKLQKRIVDSDDELTD